MVTLTTLAFQRWQPPHGDTGEAQKAAEYRHRSPTFLGFKLATEYLYQWIQGLATVSHQTGCATSL